MKTINTLKTIIAASVMALAATGCGVNDIYFDGGGENPDVPGEINGSMTEYPVMGTVTDSHGNPLAGVTVTSGNRTVTTNEAGFFYLEQTDVNYDRALVKFTKDGYFPVQRSCDLYDRSAVWTVAMSADNAEYAARTVFQASSARTLTAKGMSVAFPSDGYVVASTGEKYTGSVNAALFYLSPEAELFGDLMPGGDLAAIDDRGNEKSLVSYGMANVLLTDNQGNRLQLSDGKKATVTFPTPASMAADAPSQIPLWAFDETRGLWCEQGVATRGNDGNYTGEVSHFSWWNIDTDYDKAWIEGYVRNTVGEPLQGIKVQLNNQKSVHTDSYGHYRALIQSNCQFNVRVPSEAYGNYQPEFSITAGPAASYETIHLDITLPTMRYIAGDVVDQYDNPLAAAYEVAIPGSAPRWNNTDKDGHFKYYLPLGFSGDVVISAMTATAGVSDIVVNVPEDENVYQKIVIDVTGGGGVTQPDIIADCGSGDTHYLKAARPLPTTFGGVIIQDSCMSVMSDINEYATDNFILALSGYSPSRREYSSFAFMATQGNRGVICQDGGVLSIHEDNGTYYFNLSAKGYYIEENTVMKPANITVNNVGISHLMTLERMENYKPSRPFPSFTPALSTPAPVAVVVTKSEKLGTGGFLYYNGKQPDYDNLAVQAKHSGFNCVFNDVNSGDGYAETGYAKNNSSIVVEFDANEDAITAQSWRGIPMFDIMGEEDGYCSQLIVTSLEGGTMSLFDLNQDDDYGRYAARAAKTMRKAFPRNK